MSLQNLIEFHFTAIEIADVDAHLTAIEAIIEAKCKNLTAEEKVQYGSINEKNKLLVNKVRDYRNSQPALSAAEINWAEYEADWQDRTFLETRALRLAGIAEQMLDTKTLHDYDNYQNALVDYRYTKYKNETDGGAGYSTKYDELKQFFPNTGGGLPTPPVA